MNKPPQESSKENTTTSTTDVAKSPSTPSSPLMAVEIYYLLFAASGFAGLMYESLWARYLKLFLGHAAYAQVLVLAVFLFGLAAGAALTARVSTRLRDPLRVYVVIEIMLAVAAIYFHDIFVITEEWAVSSVLANIQTATAAEAFRWSLAAALILPQSILLGATFPLMSAGVTRLFPNKPGNVVAMLYFSNSFGAACGVLVAGFFLLPTVGLPGTSITAGFINFIVAATIWVLGHVSNNVAKPLAVPRLAKTPLSSTARLLLLTAAVTGAASFIYEIVWIRMLSLLLGSSVHSFEIILSVFILGLAIGGWIVRKRADSVTEPLALLAKVQIVMGTLALFSLSVYPYLFDILSFILKHIPRDDDGYILYLAGGFLLSLLLMLPTTICAGMTLPLLTKRLINEDGESAIGIVYAANTLGSIVGATVAVYLLLPILGIGMALSFGAGLDLVLGLVLLAWLSRRPPLVATTVISLIAVLTVGNIDPRISASGIFRYGSKQISDDFEVFFHRDGKTATISVTGNDEVRSIRTNGKPDAAIHISNANDLYTSDEATMTLLGLIPLLAKPDAELVANIGFGSGLTSRILLLSPEVRQVNSIEIEKMMVLGAQQLGERTAAVFNDPRSHIIIDDAKSFFTRSQDKYDIIVSEPSNPWVSGIGGLFSAEFYRRIRQSLASDGVFVQWTHLYESSPQIFSSIAKAMASNFSDFRLYLSSSADIIIIGVAEGKVPPLSNSIFNNDEARAVLFAYDFRSADDIKALFLGEKDSMMPYLRSFEVPANSDYFPYLENNAPRAFFQKTIYSWGGTPTIQVPFMEMVGGRTFDKLSIHPHKRSNLSKFTARAHYWIETLNDDDSILRQSMNHLKTCPAINNYAASSKYVEKITTIFGILMPYISRQEAADVWRIMEENKCINSLLQQQTVYGRYVQFWRALSLRQTVDIAQLAAELRPASDPNSHSGQILILAEMAANYQLGKYSQVIGLLNQLPPNYPIIHHAARFIAANAAEHL